MSLTRPLNIAILTVADLPEGGGNTSRLRALSRALVENGHKVSIWNQHALGVAPHESLRSTGLLGGAKFEFVLNSTTRSYGISGAGIKLRAVKAIAQRIRCAAVENDLDLLWFNALSFYDVYPLTILARRLGIPTIQAYEDERYDIVSANSGWSLKRIVFALNSFLADAYCPSLADAVVVISRYLQEKYQALVRSSQQVHLLPVIIDCSEWELPNPPSTETPQILYAGTFGEQDELQKVVEACKLLAGKGLSFRVKLLGANERESRRVEAIRNAVQQMGLTDVMEMEGFLPAAKVKEYIERSHVLINIRRPGTWSVSGLSTKMSEYLASGRAVVTSDVGEITRYVRHDESALVVPEEYTPESIASCLERVLTSRELCLRLGENGRKVARQHFDIGVARKTLGIILQGVLSG